MYQVKAGRSIGFTIPNLVPGDLSATDFRIMKNSFMVLQMTSSNF
jgi:hypothetical protein